MIWGWNKRDEFISGEQTQILSLHLQYDQIKLEMWTTILNVVIAYLDRFSEVAIAGRGYLEITAGPLQPAEDIWIPPGSTTRK